MSVWWDEKEMWLIKTCRLSCKVLFWWYKRRKKTEGYWLTYLIYIKQNWGGLVVDWSRDVMELAKIRFRQIQKLCFNNLSDSDADLPRDHSLFCWIAMYWYLYILNIKSDDISWSHLAFNIIQTSRNSYLMCICLLLRGKKNGWRRMMKESFMQRTVSPNPPSL